MTESNYQTRVCEAPDKLDLTKNTMYNFFIILHFSLLSLSTRPSSFYITVFFLENPLWAPEKLQFLRGNRFTSLVVKHFLSDFYKRYVRRFLFRPSLYFGFEVRSSFYPTLDYVTVFISQYSIHHFLQTKMRCRETVASRVSSTQTLFNYMY